MDPETAARLLVENRDQRAALAALTRELEQSRAEAAAQRKLTEKSQRQVQQLVERLNELTDMLRRFMRARDLPAVEVPDDPEPEPPDDPGPPASGGTAGNTAGGAAKGGGVRSHKPKAPGRGGRKGPAASLPTDVVAPSGPERCPDCHHPRLLARDVEVSWKFTAVTGFVRRLEIRRKVCVCAACNVRVSAAMPPMPWEGSQFTPELLAFVVYMKFALLVPLDRIHKMLQSQGVDIAWSSMVYLIERASGLFEGIDGVHWKQLRAGTYMGVDGTGLDVVVPGLDRVWKGYLDVFCREHLHVYQYSETKHADVLAEKLGGFKGTIVCDAEFRMDRLFGVDVKEANCNAHPRRKFKDAQKQHPILAREGKSFIDRMYAIEEEARLKGIVGPALRHWRGHRTRPVAEAFRKWIGETLLRSPPLLPTDPLGRVVRYYDRHFDALTRFVDDPDLPIDNNRSERGFQMHAKLRVNAEFAGSPEGANRWGILLGVVNTAKRLGVNVLAYLTWAIERRGTWKKVYGMPATALTPEAYAQECAAKAAATALAA